MGNDGLYDLAYTCVNANMFTALSLYKNLGAKFLLESASLENAKGRYSILVLSENFRLFKENSRYKFILDSITYDLEKLENLELPLILKYVLESKKADSKLDSKKLDFLAYSRLFRESYPILPQELKELPLPFGGLGYVGYEFFSECEDMTFAKKCLYDAPEAMLIFPRECVIIDHFYDEMYIVVSLYKDSNLEAQKLLDSITLKLQNIKNIETPKLLESKENIESKIVYEDSKDWYEKHVKVIKNEIYKGTFLQCVLSRAVSIESNLNPLYFYETLRRNNPSPYMYYLDFSRFKIIGASPEVMLVCKNGTQMLRPIAGTRKRGMDRAEDEALERELKSDEKENAEHLMLVDLGRNDLGRNAVVGSVRLSAFRVIERYSSVMHIVSEVVADILCGRDSSDCFKACFPAGTVSGAPKIEAIHKLEIYEPTRRGIYSGAILCFMRNGDLNSAITLRSAVYTPNVLESGALDSSILDSNIAESSTLDSTILDSNVLDSKAKPTKGIYHLRAGAGIVMDSNPEMEFLETTNKMKALYDILMDL